MIALLRIHLKGLCGSEILRFSLGAPFCHSLPRDLPDQFTQKGRPEARSSLAMLVFQEPLRSLSMYNQQLAPAVAVLPTW